MQTNVTVKCGAGKMPGVGGASLRERLPRTQMGCVFAVGLVFLTVPASSAQSAFRATYALSSPVHTEMPVHSAGQSMSRGDGLVGRLWLPPNDTTLGVHAIRVNLQQESPPRTSSERRISPIPADAASLRLPAGQPFELSTTSLVRGEPLVRTWQGIQAGMRDEMANLALCHAQSQTCSPAAQKLDKIISEGRSRSGLARIGVINRAVNMAIKSVDDPYGWHSPLEALSMGEGDCKDYAVTKYFALLEVGVLEQDVKLLIVHDVKVNQDHAIVAVRFDDDWIILDNRWLALVRDVEMHRAVPLYALDSNGVSRFSRQQAQSNSRTPADFTTDAIRARRQ
jgi:predicted transglutaminase-like cysteine proteinase